MTSALRSAAAALSARLRAAGSASFKATQQECTALETAIGRSLPAWVRELLEDYALCGSEVFWQAFPPEDGFDGIGYVVLACPKIMAAESTETYPGIGLLRPGFLCIGADDDGIGDSYFVSLHETDPAVFRVHHDDVIADHRVGEYPATLVAKHLSEFLNLLTPAAPPPDCTISGG